MYHFRTNKWSFHKLSQMISSFLPLISSLIPIAPLLILPQSLVKTQTCYGVSCLRAFILTVLYHALPKAKFT